jgi:hypothetical protein
MLQTSTLLHRFIYAFGFLLCINASLFSQDKIALGISGMYNFPLQSVGLGLRAQIPVLPRVYIVPQIKYAPAFNTIHELYSGVNLHYLIIKGNERFKGFKRSMESEKPTIYLTGGVEYNRWINYVETRQTNSKQNNILPEVGIGSAIGNYSIRFFAEVKYNILWKESYGEVGIMICPAYIKLKRKANCPVIY